MSEIILDYKPKSKQYLFHKNDAKFKAFIGGLGSGKTWAGSIESITTAIKYPNSLGCILASTYRLLSDSTQRTFMSLLPYNLVKHFSKSDNILTLKNNSEIMFRSCEEQSTIDRLRNIEFGWFWMDEARNIPEYAWRVMIGRLRQKNSPLKGWITTTPKGYNWIWDKFVKSPTKDYFWIHSISEENTSLPKEYLESLKSEYSGTFLRQEYYAEFCTFEGLVYSSFQRSNHVKEFDIRKEVEGQSQWAEICVGCDIGYSNPTAIIVMGFDNDGRAYLIDEFYQRRITMETVINQLKLIIGNCGKTPYRIYVDPSEPQYIEQMRAAGLSCTPANNEIISGIAKVDSYLAIQADGKPRLFVHPRCVNTIMEFESYQYEETKEGKPTKDKPLKINDHLMDAIRYVLMSKSMGRFSIGILEDKDNIMGFGTE